MSKCYGFYIEGGCTDLYSMPVNSFTILLLIMERQHQLNTKLTQLIFSKNYIVFEDVTSFETMLGIVPHFGKSIQNGLKPETHDYAVELMKATGFEGALDDFLEARSDLISGDHAGAIYTGVLGFRSTIKVYNKC